MTTSRRNLQEFMIVMRGVWVNIALYAALLFVSAVLLTANGCYPDSTFTERLVAAFYMTRLESVDGSNHHPLVAVLVFALPALSVLILGEGVFRIASLYHGRKLRTQEWERLMISTLSNHTVLCGAGELGRALILEMLRRNSDTEIVIIDTKDDILQELGLTSPNVRHINGDMTSFQVLESANLKTASTLILTSGNDAYNLESTYKALRLNPDITIWVRLYRSGISEFLDTSSLTNIHFFSPYQQAAEVLAEELYHPMAAR